MISTEQLSKAVYDRMYAEQQAFRKELLQMKPEDILEYLSSVYQKSFCQSFQSGSYAQTKISYS